MRGLKAPPHVEEWGPQVRNSPKGSCTQQITRQENEGIAWTTEEGLPMKDKMKEPIATALSTQGDWLKRSVEGSGP